MLHYHYELKHFYKKYSSINHLPQNNKNFVFEIKNHIVADYVVLPYLIGKLKLRLHINNIIYVTKMIITSMKFPLIDK